MASAPTEEETAQLIPKVPSRPRRLSRQQSKVFDEITKDEGFFVRNNILEAVIEESYSRARHLDDNTYYCRFATIAFLIIAATALGICVNVFFNTNTKTKFYYASYVGIFGFMALVFMFIDFFDKFDPFQRFFERFSLPLFISFAVFAFVCYVLIQLKKDIAVFQTLTFTIIIDVLFYLALFLMFGLWMALWKTFRFYCIEQPWVHALIYLTVIGYAVVKAARWLRPHPGDGNGMDSWHCNHRLKVILPKLVLVEFVLFLVIVALGRVGIALFAEFSLQASALGVGVSLFLFCVIAMVIMLTPLMPGSIVDACGGFVFTQVLVLNGGMTLAEAWAVGFTSVVALHFIGACAQWWIGSWRAIQIWGNSNLPVELLAMSDAVLRTANFIKVGLIGFIFMDTANGLNQGRINMEFWTQLISEYANIPGAFALVSLGASLAAQGIPKYASLNSASAVAIPLLILLATFVQTFGVSFAARAIGDSVDKAPYWTSREKWTMVHYFQSFGYSPTEEGWENDLFSLSKVSLTGVSKALFDTVAPIHENYLKRREAAPTPDDKLAVFEGYRQELNDVRETHYSETYEKLEELVQKGWLLYEEPFESREGLFTPDKLGASDNLKRFYMILVMILTIFFWFSFYSFYNSITTQNAVKSGMKALNVIKVPAWIIAGLFVLMVCVIWSMEIWNAVKSFGVTFLFVITCCRTNPLLETKFETPEYTVKDTV